jgi:glutamyl-tRNA synthetase
MADPHGPNGPSPPPNDSDASMRPMPDGRFAPSPTGDLHLGNLRTALLAWLFARSAGGRFRLRLEDLDTASVRPAFYGSQPADLAALGLDWDGPVVRQSDRLDLYRDAIARLEVAGETYPCFCTRREIQEAASAPNGPAPDGAYPGTCRRLSSWQRAEREAAGRRPALRLRGDGVRLSFVDAVTGPYEGLVDDVVIRRNDGTPAYNLAVVVDDVEQGIGLVVRGDDLLASTPRQLHIADRLGLPAPSFAHVPLVLAPDGERLAKRHGAVTLADRLALGDTPAVVAGRLAASAGLLDHPAPLGTDDLSELAATFDADRLVRSPWVLTEEEVALPRTR